MKYLIITRILNEIPTIPDTISCFSSAQLYLNAWPKNITNEKLDANYKRNWIWFTEEDLYDRFTPKPNVWYPYLFTEDYYDSLSTLFSTRYSEHWFTCHPTPIELDEHNIHAILNQQLLSKLKT